MVTAADGTLHLRVTADDRGEFDRVAQRNSVHVRDPALERRMVHADQRGLIWLLREHAVQPVQAPLA